MNKWKGCVTNAFFRIVSEIRIVYTNYCYKCNMKKKKYPDKRRRTTNEFITYCNKESGREQSMQNTEIKNG